MDINRFNQLIRQAVNDNNAAAWHSASDHRAFCEKLLGSFEAHEVVKNILIDVVDELLQRKAEDKYGNYTIGDGVTILESGHCIPATVIKQTNNSEDLTVQLDKVFTDGHFEKDKTGEVIEFHRSHDRVYVHIEGRTLSRLVAGRKFVDYSPEHLKEEMERLTSKKQLAC
ncbi:hypothetical protein ACMXYX_04215 [Neptuniibacter sp. QD72_48]|uniref:hypothetical protein n=1 Tax=unclassified Neptuniibacter TaxID=2630693 RepID=UPI0039F6C1BC